MMMHLSMFSIPHGRHRLCAIVPERADRAVKRLMNDDPVWGDNIRSLVNHWEMKFDESKPRGRPANRLKFWLVKAPKTSWKSALV